MRILKTTVFLIFTFFLSSVTNLNAQCNVSASVCETGTAGPFNFIPTSGSYAGGSFVNAGCATGAGGNHAYAFITLNITTSGPLNLLINGNSNNGFVDVAIFNIPNGTSPCDAITSGGNAIGCNFASASSGCVQFGNAFNCPSTVPAPNVNAGDEIMIIAQNWSTPGSSTFSLELHPSGAQSGPPNATIQQAGPFCLGEDPFQLIAANMGGDWSGPGVSSTGLFDPTAAGIGNHTINYNIGSGNCASSSQTVLEVNPGSPVFAEIVGEGSSVTICDGESVTISASGVETYVWDNGVGAGATHVVSPSSTTTYTVTGTDIDGCSDVASVTVNISPAPTATASADQLICLGASTNISVSGSGGTSYNYHWGHTSTNSDTVTVTPDESTTYTVSVENEFGCMSPPDEVFVELFPAPNGNVSPDLTVCPGDTVMYFVNGFGGGGGPYSYIWRDQNNNVISETDTMYANPFDAAVYTVEIRDVCGTKPTFIDVNAFILPFPDLDFVVDDDAQCKPALFTITNTTQSDLNHSYYWFVSEGSTFGNDNTIEVEIDETGLYDVRLVIETADGCLDSITKPNFLTVHPDPIADFNWIPNPLTILDTEALFQNSSQGGQSYEWYFESGIPGFSSQQNPTVNYPIGEVGLYDVDLYVTSEFGCTDSIIKQVEVVPEVTLFVPNAFTPDDDMFNEEWRPYIDGIDIMDFQLIIYNRWGEVMWESYDPSAAWNGTYGGQKVKEGTYIWRIKAADMITDKKYEWQGHVLVIY